MSDKTIEMWKEMKSVPGKQMEYIKKNPNFLKDYIKNQNYEDYGLINIWLETAKDVRQDQIIEIINMLKEKATKARNVWGLTEPDIRLKKFNEVCAILKKENIDAYKKFVSSYIADIEFDTQNNPIIPEELGKIIFNPSSEEKAKTIEKEMSTFIKNWDMIYKNMQYIKANNLLYGNIEIRANYDLVSKAYATLTRIKPKNASGIEFEMTSGSERVGKEYKYTRLPETAVQRAHILAEKMDNAGLEKKFPDFSVKDDKSSIVLKVLHPQDKSAILLGYDTTCCFVPNGQADNFAWNEYSLLQYCTSTPYGGIIKCGELNEKGTDFSQVYMGSPVLVNGNCMMLHSYETNNGLQNETVNKLLVEAAKNAIKLSNGDIKAVMMTGLHVGGGRLNISDKIIMNSFFEPYLQEEYDAYNNMYNNLDWKNILLAVQVGEEILSGEKLKQWYEKECEGKQINAIKNLNLKLGRIDKNYQFENRIISFERKIDNLPLIKAFKKQYELKKNERMILALYKTKIQLEEKNKLNVKEQKQLKCIQDEIERLEPEKKVEYGKLGLRKLENQLKENFKEIMDIYSGNNLQLLAEQKGIEKEQLEKMIKLKAQERAKEETINVKSETKREDMEKQKIVKYSKDDVFRKQVLVEQIFSDENDGEKNKGLKKLFDKLRASITIGIEKKEEMDRIIDNINENNINKENYDHIIFGANWYIATGINGEMEMYIKEQANESERIAMDNVVQKMILSATNKTEAEKITSKYAQIMNCEISMEQIEKSTNMITGPEKVSAVATIEKEMNAKEKGIEDGTKCKSI